MDSLKAAAGTNSSNTSRKTDSSRQQLVELPQVTSRFAALPADVRNLILLLALPKSDRPQGAIYRRVTAIKLTCRAGAGWAQALYEHMDPIRQAIYDTTARRVTGVNWENPPAPNKTLWRLTCLDRIMRAKPVIKLQQWESNIQHAILDAHFQQFPFKRLDADFLGPYLLSADKLVNLTRFLLRHSGVEGRPFVKINLLHHSEFDVSQLAQALGEYGNGTMSLSFGMGSTSSPAFLADTLRRGVVSHLELALTGLVSDEKMQKFGAALAADRTLEKLTLNMNLGPDLERLIQGLRGHPKLQTLRLDVWGEEDADLECIFLAAQIPNLKSLSLNLDNFYPDQEFEDKFAKLPGARMTIVKPWWAKD